MMTSLFLLATTFLAPAMAGKCELLAPLEDRPSGPKSPTAGLIIVPGAHLGGATYLPLLAAIQAAYPGSLWVGATSDWNNEMPTPFEVTQQINRCLEAAEDRGIDTENVFMAGHSLGGVVLQSYIATHGDAAKAVAFIGTWLPDLLGGPVGSNAYPVPVGTFIGELDGGGVSYLRREVEETALLPQEEQELSKTVLVPGVNHAQVSSGTIPEDVIDNDIDPELSEKAAHYKYGVRVADWLCLQAFSLGIMSEEVAAPAMTNFPMYEQETTAFLAPFVLAYRAEQEGGKATFVPFAQDIIMDLSPEEAASLEVTNEILGSFGLFQGYQPNVEVSEGVVRITTYSYLQYDLDILDFNAHLSASTVKAKMKLADSIYPLLSLPARDHIVQCAQINRAVMDWAISEASTSALERMAAKGRSLTFGPDMESSFGGAGWDFSGGLQWKEIPAARSVQLTASKLTSEPNFPLFPGEHYCDLLSPYRALEWIYIESIRHKMQF